MKQTNKWVSAVFGMLLSATATMAVCEQAEAAFGSTRASSSSVGVSRSYSRPSSPSSYSRPAAAPSSSYSAPSRYTPATRTYTPPSYNQPRSSGYDSSRQRQDYNRGGYGNGGGGYQQPQNNSAMRQIGITAAGVGGGILAASAISSLIHSPSHPGMYTSPTNPGQYYNAQGVPQGAPTEQAAQEQRMQTEPMQQQYAPAQAPQVQYVQAAPVKKEGGGFFGFLWGVLGFILHLILWLSVVGILGYGGYKLYKYLKAKYAQEKANSVFDLSAEQINLEHNAQDVFYEFQANSDNKEWLTKRTKYIDIDEAMSPKSTVLSYEQSDVTVALEQGKLRGSVRYRATLKNAGGEESINQWYNFEKDTGVWKVIGVEAA